MIHPNVENLLGVESVEGSKFQLVTLASYRARQINSYFQKEIAAEKIVRVERLDEAELEAEFAEVFGDEALADGSGDDSSGSADE
jgi:hypothetical protein